MNFEMFCLSFTSLKTNILTSFLLLSVAMADAAPSLETPTATPAYGTQAEPIYPPVVMAFSKLVFQSRNQKQLPPNVHFMISEGTESNEDPNLIGKVCFIDLNGDGIKEIIVESPSARTNQYEIYQQRKESWASILTVWSSPNLLSKRNAYYQISTQSEDRHGEGRRELYVFEGERYHLVRMDEYKDGVFIRPLDVKERENAWN